MTDSTKPCVVNADGQRLHLFRVYVDVHVWVLATSADSARRAALQPLEDEVRTQGAVNLELDEYRVGKGPKPDPDELDTLPFGESFADKPDVELGDVLERFEAVEPDRLQTTIPMEKED